MDLFRRRHLKVTDGAFPILPTLPDLHSENSSSSDDCDDGSRHHPIFLPFRRSGVTFSSQKLEEVPCDQKSTTNSDCRQAEGTTSSPSPSPSPTSNYSSYARENRSDKNCRESEPSNDRTQQSMMYSCLPSFRNGTRKQRNTDDADETFNDSASLLSEDEDEDHARYDHGERRRAKSCLSFGRRTRRKSYASDRDDEDDFDDRSILLDHDDSRSWGRGTGVSGNRSWWSQERRGTPTMLKHESSQICGKEICLFRLINDDDAQRQKVSSPKDFAYDMESFLQDEIYESEMKELRTHTGMNENLHSRPLAGYANRSKWAEEPTELPSKNNALRVSDQSTLQPDEELFPREVLFVSSSSWSLACDKSGSAVQLQESPSPEGSFEENVEYARKARTTFLTEEIMREILDDSVATPVTTDRDRVLIRSLPDAAEIFASNRSNSCPDLIDHEVAAGFRPIAQKHKRPSQKQNQNNPSRSSTEATMSYAMKEKFAEVFEKYCIDTAPVEVPVRKKRHRRKVQSW